MRFEPKTQEQIDEDGLFPAGTYDCEVLTAEDTQSKAGNDMIALTLRVYHGEHSRVVKDWLLEALAYKLRHAAEAFGCMRQYEAGNLGADDLLGKTGKCKLKLEPAKGDFPAKNSVTDYVPDEVKISDAAEPLRRRAMAPSSERGLDDEIPF